MANKKITQLTSYTTPVSADVIPIVDVANSSTKKVTIANLFNILSSLFTIKDSSDTTKKVAFDVSGVTTATTRTLTVPNENTTIVGTGATQTLTNKTLSTGTKINTSGSDVTGSMYYKDSSGNLTAFSGTTDQIVSFDSSGIPTAIPNPAAADATYTTKGVIKALTDAATSGLVIASGVMNVNMGTTANKVVQLDSSAKLPAVDGSQLTNLPFYFTKVSTVTISTTVPTSTETTIAQFTGLTGDTDDEYIMEYEFTTDAATGASTTYSAVTLNNDTTANHYQYIGSIVDSSSLTTIKSTAFNATKIITAQASASINPTNFFGTTKIKASKTIAGTLRSIFSTSTLNAAGGNGATYTMSGSWSDTSNQVTSVELKFNQASGGTANVSGKATLYKINR